MLSLIKAFRLCNIRDDEIIYFRRPHHHSATALGMSGREVRRKLDMRSIQVIHIDIKHDYYGNWMGWEFEVTGD